MPTDSAAALTAVFDLDGTLIDSAPDIAGAANQALHALGRDPLPVDQMMGFVGDGAKMLMRRALNAAFVNAGGQGREPDPDQIDTAYHRFLDSYQANPVAQTKIYAGVVEGLAALRDAGVRLGLCTNKHEAIARVVLDRLGLMPWFPVICGCDTVATRKPDPAPLRWVLDRLDATPAATVMIGDSANDIGAAKGAGTRSILVTYGYGRPEAAALGPDATVGDFGAVTRTVLSFRAPPTDD